MSFINEYIVQYGFPPNEDGEQHWEDELTDKLRFDPEDGKAQKLALKVAKAYAEYCDYQAADDDEFPITHRVLHRITSDVVVE